MSDRELLLSVRCLSCKAERVLKLHEGADDYPMCEKCHGPMALIRASLPPWTRT